MKKICFYFQVHQPCRISQYSFFELGNHNQYWNESLDQKILNEVADESYLPANKLLLSLIKKHQGNFNVSFSLSGILIEQLEKYRPDILASFQELVQTGCVEIIAETYYHSLSALYNEQEFIHQVQLHQEKIKEIFGVETKTFRNTELIYSNQIAKQIKQLGFETTLTEGIEWNLNERTPNQFFKAKDENLHLLIRNTHLSDDIAFRFANSSWAEFPLTAEKYLAWCKKEEGDVINLFMDYETIGESQKKTISIFDFLEEFIDLAIEEKNIFQTPNQMIPTKFSKEEYHVPLPISWGNQSKDISTWLGNAMQKEALLKIYTFNKAIQHRKDLLETWRKLQVSNLFYYMNTKTEEEEEKYHYIRPYPSAYDTYIFYMNIISDLKNRL